jgi:emfourin
MKVSVVRGGGVSGLVTVTTVDSRTLSPDDSKALSRMVEEADAFDGPDVAATDRAAPDEFQVSVTLEDATRRRTVTAAEHDLPSRLRSLVDWVSAAPGRTEEVGPPGSH